MDIEKRATFDYGNLYSTCIDVAENFLIEIVLFFDGFIENFDAGDDRCRMATCMRRTTTR